MAEQYQIRVCENTLCGLRYPLVVGHPFGERCPLCLGSTKAALTRTLSPEPFSPLENTIPTLKVEALLDNIRSAWNVGAIFRTADGLGVGKLYLCGITPTPDNEPVRKTALGAENSVKWESARDAVKLAKKLKAEGVRLWALEQDERSVSLWEADARTDFEAPRENAGQADKRIAETDSCPSAGARKRTVLIVGNEVTGVDPGLLDLCERIVHIPMRGSKRSLNVEVAFGVAISALLNTRG